MKKSRTYKPFDSVDTIKKIMACGNTVIIIEKNQNFNIGYADILKRKYHGNLNVEHVKASHEGHPLEYTEVTMADLHLYIFKEGHIKVKFGNVFKPFVQKLNYSGVYEVIKTYTSIEGDGYDVAGLVLL